MKKLFTLLLALLFLVPSASLAATDGFTVQYGDREQKKIALTIDDCYGIEHVREALEISEQYDIPFTFFVLGNVLKQDDAALWQAVATSICEIGNHTYNHTRLLTLSDKDLYTQVMQTQASLDAVLGYHYPMQVIRPPFGSWNSTVNRVFRSLGYDHTTLWDIDSTDPDECYKHIKNGSILLFHARAKDIRCIETLLPLLLEDGYELVTVSEMFGKEPVAISDEPYTFVRYSDWREQQK